ncbi:MAG: hypothetical protein ACK4F5_14125 [Aliihoeflea sp.]
MSSEPEPKKADIVQEAFNKDIDSALPFDLRIRHLQSAMEDVYDFFHDVNSMLIRKGLQRLDDMLRPAAMSGMISDMLTASLARQSRTLVENKHFNGHPDLLVRGKYPGDATPSGREGVEVKSTVKRGGAVDTHGGRDQWMCVFVYETFYDENKPAHEQEPMRFVEVYLAEVAEADFRHNNRGTLGTRTSTLHRDGLQKLRKGTVYMLPKTAKATGSKRSKS